jgi:hypothetical protein
MPYWIEANDNLARVCASHGGCLLIVVSLCWRLGCNAFMRLVARHRGSSYWSSRPLCRDGDVVLSL